MKRIAIVSSIYRYLSHAQHMGDRFLIGYPHEGKWRKPDVQVVSLYVDQKPPGDQSAERAKEFGFTVYPTIAETLRCGTDKLAVDGVVIICEHGEYPRNELGQVLYPRYEFFKACTEVFEKDGRAVPVYNDKHLSFSFTKAKWMLDEARRLKFPVLAGSSLPVTWRLPDIEIPLGSQIDEALMVGVGGSDPMDYHALEAMQCMIERRKGGETGIRSVQLIDGEAAWKAPYSQELLIAAVAQRYATGAHRRGRTHAGPGADGRTEAVGGQAGGLSDRTQRWPEDHAADVERRREGLHLRGQGAGPRNDVDAVPADAGAERDLLGVSRQQD